MSSYSVASISAVENTDPMCEAPDADIMSRAARRISRERFSIDAEFSGGFNAGPCVGELRSQSRKTNETYGLKYPRSSRSDVPLGIGATCYVRPSAVVFGGMLRASPPVTAFNIPLTLNIMTNCTAERIIPVDI